MTVLWLTADHAAVPGRAEEVRSLASGIDHYAEELTAARWGVSRAVARISSWRGYAADACRARLGELADALMTCERAARRAARALWAYEAQLADAQVEAARAADLWADADAMTRAWGAPLAYAGNLDPVATRPGDDPGAEQRAWAQAVLGSAFARRDAAATSTLVEVREVDSVLRGFASWRLPSELVAHVARDAGQGLVQGLSELAGAALWVARVPFHPGQAAGDARESAAWTLTHPVEAAKVAVGWEDLTGGHPARALAAAVPGLGASYLTGGVSRGVSSLRRDHDDGPGLLGETWNLDGLPAPTPTQWLGGEREATAAVHRIVDGHAWDKHAGQWLRRGVESKAALLAKVSEAMRHPTFWMRLTKGRALFWDEGVQMVVLHNPNPQHEGTTYPANWKEVLRIMRNYFADPRMSDDFRPDEAGGEP